MERKEPGRGGMALFNDKNGKGMVKGLIRSGFGRCAVLLLALSLSVSCGKNGPETALKTGFRIGMPQTKGTWIREADEGTVRRVTVAVYEAGGPRIGLFTLSSERETTPDVTVIRGHAYVAYAVAGRLAEVFRFPDREGEVALAEAIPPSGTVWTTAEYGMDYSGSLRFVAADRQTVEIPMECLFAKVRLTLKNVSSRYEITAPRWHAVSRPDRIRPFGSMTYGTSDVGVGEDASPAESASAVLYVFPSDLGNLLPGNRDPYAKNRENLLSRGVSGAVADRIPQVSLSVSYQDRSDRTTIRDRRITLYLGADAVSDFTVERNAVYDVTVRLTDTGLQIEDNSKSVETGSRSLQVRPSRLAVERGGSAPFEVDFRRNGLPDAVHACWEGVPFSRRDPDRTPADTWRFSVPSAYARQVTLTETSFGGAWQFRIALSADLAAGTVIPVTVSTLDGRIRDVMEVTVTGPTGGDVGGGWEDDGTIHL